MVDDDAYDLFESSTDGLKTWPVATLCATKGKNSGVPNVTDC